MYWMSKTHQNPIYITSMYVYMYIRIYIHTYIHTYIHIYNIYIIYIYIYIYYITLKVGENNNLTFYNSKFHVSNQKYSNTTHITRSNDFAVNKKIDKNL